MTGTATLTSAEGNMVDPTWVFSSDMWADHMPGDDPARSAGGRRTWRMGSGVVLLKDREIETDPGAELAVF
jgi:hypothetical protein